MAASWSCQGTQPNSTKPNSTLTLKPTLTLKLARFGYAGSNSTLGVTTPRPRRSCFTPAGGLTSAACCRFAALRHTSRLHCTAPSHAVLLRLEPPRAALHLKRSDEPQSIKPVLLLSNTLLILYRGMHRALTRPLYCTARTALYRTTPRSGASK